MPFVPYYKPLDDIYSRSQLTRRRGNGRDFDDVCARVRQFSQASIIDTGARFLWALRSGPDELTKLVGDRQLTQLVWSHAAGVFGLACIFGNDHRQRANFADFAILAYELYLCPSGSHLLNDPEHIEKARLIRDEFSKRAGYGRLARIADSQARLILVASFTARLARVQRPRHIGGATSLDVRAIAVYAGMKKLAFQEGQDVAAALERAERLVLRTDFVNYARALTLLRIFADRTAERDPLRSDNCPGVVLLRKNQVLGPEWRTTRWDDILVTADRLATRPRDHGAARARISRLASSDRAFSEPVWFLHDRPAFRLPCSDVNAVSLMLPSPWLLTGFVERELLYDIPSAIQTEHAATVLRLRGDALQEYLRDALASQKGIVDVDALPGLRRRRHPDFVWIGDRYGVVIEVKTTLSPLNDYGHRDPKSIAVAWGVGCTAIEQGAALLATNHAAIAAYGPRTWVFVLATMEPGAADVTQFVSAAKLWSFVDDTPFVAVHVAHVSELEHFVLAGSPDEYAELLIARWNRLKPDFLSHEPPLAFQEESVPFALSRTWNLLFPAETNPWSSP